MIAVNNLSVYFSGTYLFNTINFNIGDRDRIGLVGKNGAGKSTLLKILAGLQEPETGTITIASGQTIGYLPQEMIPNIDKTVIDEASTAFEHINEIAKKIDAITKSISERTDYESDEYTKLLENLHELNERFHLLGGNNCRENTEKVLLGLGFLHTDFNRSVTEFSTGWQMRIELAKILLKQPDFFLLDEPTNHLDIESIQWLENFLINYNGALMLVSHDRTFLDNVTKRTIEITAGKIYDYKASYSEYIILLEERRQSQQATLNNQQKQIADIERFVERFRSKATKAKQVQSRIKMLDKMDLVEVDAVDTNSIHFKFSPAPHSGKVVAELINLSKSYGEKEVLKNLNLLINRGESIAFVGKNGEGKSTLSKIIVREITDYTGEYKGGHQVSIGYFAQNQAALLDGEKTVFETIDSIAEGEIRSRIRSILGGFLFSGEDIDKKVKVLSGGEKTRLALAKLLLTPSNLLVLDEPTNHLDMKSKDVLKNALLQYTGTLIIVSHDRDFLQGLTDTIYEFKNKTIREFKGDIFEFLEARKIADLQELEKAKQQNANAKQGKVAHNKNQYHQSKEQEREIRKLKNSIEKTEEQIAFLEKQIEEQDHLLAEQPDILFSKPDFYANYEAMKAELTKLLSLWEEKNMLLDEMDE